jgi:hypothetical protein
VRRAESCRISSQPALRRPLGRRRPDAASRRWATASCKACFGNKFAGSLDASALSKRTSAGAPNSALANARLLNLAVCEEGGVSDRLSAALVKELTGGTQLQVRDLNQRQPADCANNMTIICMSNQAHSFDYPDAATDARMLRVDQVCDQHRYTWPSPHPARQSFGRPTHPRQEDQRLALLGSHQEAGRERLPDAQRVFLVGTHTSLHAH